MNTAPFLRRRDDEPACLVLDVWDGIAIHGGHAMNDHTSEITGFIKSGGPLTKLISLAADGSINNDSSACVMSSGEARRIPITDVKQLTELIGKLKPNEAIALGALRYGLSDKVAVVTKNKLNGGAHPDLIARTVTDIVYRPGQTAFALLDYDTKGMPPEVAAEMHRHGGFWQALIFVMPALRGVAHVTRRSTSAGLSRSDTGENLPGSDGLHIYIAVQDGADIERFLKALHDRCWIAGMGWMMVGAGGQLLERSIVDRSVGGPERLVFEGGPILVPPLGQDQESRRPIATDGSTLDTVATCPPLTTIEKIKLREQQAKAAYQLASESAKARAAFIHRQAKLIVERTGMSPRDATKVVEQQCDGVLLPALVLPFDDADFANCTVANVLDDPQLFDGATMADPLEGVAYGRCKAKIMLRSDGAPWIHSFAHGRTTYELTLDAAAVRAAMDRADDKAVVQTFLDLAAAANLELSEQEELRNVASERSGINKRTISAMLKAAQEKHAAKRANQERKRREAERSDPRPSILVPAIDAPWRPQMETLNGVIGFSSAAEPPVRDIDGVITRARRIPVPGTHAFTDANSEVFTDTNSETGD
jgi:hypothetical protein